MPELQIGRRWIGTRHPTYFVADISANHDGDLDRAKMLIRLAKEAGADAAKFQNFRAARIVSDRGFKALPGQLSHQAKWKKSVFEVYQDASIPFEWTPILKETSDKAGIDYFSAPYDFEAIDMLDAHVSMYKVGSGDITWLESLIRIAGKRKPLFLATGASTEDDVRRALDAILPLNRQVVLMQCNTNYTVSPDNFKHIHLNVLKSWAVRFPELVLGFSDHMPGHSAVLGAVAIGARVIEKHFTDDTGRVGPDHPFSMTPRTLREMVDRTRELEDALGSSSKFICENEKETVVLQRRCLRAAIELSEGTVLARAHIDVLRPASPDSIPPCEIESVLGRRLRDRVDAGQHLQYSMFDD